VHAALIPLHDHCGEAVCERIHIHLQFRPGIGERMHCPTFHLHFFQAVLPHQSIVADLIRWGWLVVISSGVARCTALTLRIIINSIVVFFPGCGFILHCSKLCWMGSTGTPILLLMAL